MPYGIPSLAYTIRFPANSLYTPIENTVYMKNVSPMGLVVVVVAAV